jgi:Mg2+/citrate symporter
MKLLDILLFTGALAFFVIGIYEAMVLGIGQAYGIFMISLGLLFVFNYRKRTNEKNETDK